MAGGFVATFSCDINPAATGVVISIGYRAGTITSSWMQSYLGEVSAAYQGRFPVYIVQTTGAVASPLPATAVFGITVDGSGYNASDFSISCTNEM